MKLFYAPAACSLACHIALLEAGLKFSAIQVDLKTKTLPDGTSFYAINPQGWVPALQLKNGEILTEATAILQYIADQAPASNLAPAHGSFARYKLQSWLSFIATELHKNFSPLFEIKLLALDTVAPGATDYTLSTATARLVSRFTHLNQQLPAHGFLLGEYFTVADAYLYTVCGWAKLVRFDLTPYPALLDYLGRLAARPAIQAALAAEGLIRKGA